MKVGSILPALVLTGWMTLNAFPSTARAQEVATQRGGRVQLRLALDGTQPASLQCDGKITEQRQDTLAVESLGDCPPGTFRAEVRVAHGTRGSRLEHAVLGMIAGGIAGWLLQGSTANESCGNTGCDVTDARYVSGIRTAAGVVTGALVGTVLRTILPAGPRWVEAKSAHFVRISGIVLRPELRVSFARSVRH